MPADAGAVLAALVDLAADEARWSELREEQVPHAHPELHAQALACFGSWSAALLAALRHSLSTSPGAARRPVARPETPAAESVWRQRTGAERDPLYLSTTLGLYVRLEGDDLEIGENPDLLEGLAELGAPTGVQWLGSSDSLFLFSTTGRYFGIDPRMIPAMADGGAGRTIRDILFLEAGEAIGFALTRSSVQTGRVVHVSAQGKGKASDGADFGRLLDRTGREGFLLGEGDRPVAVFAAPTRSGIFCASAMGQGIHFEGSELRSMGRKAVGVQLMRLEGPQDAVIAGFASQGVGQLAVITSQGLAKRVGFEEFRPQGRAGAGMQLARLNPGDRLVGCVPCEPGQDLLVLTSRGALWRLPATAFGLMGRAAKGARLLELGAEETLTGLFALPCSTDSALEDAGAPSPTPQP